MTDKLDTLAGALPAGKGKAEADWNPPLSGHLDMRIGRDGNWFYQGEPMVREALVKLFAGILRLEQGCYYLVTPVEKYSITVDGLPFVSRQLEVRDPGPHQQVVVTSNVGDVVVLGSEHPLCFRPAGNAEAVPCIHVRDGLYMLLQRSHFYQLAEMALEQSGDSDSIPGILSCGMLFALHV